ncbi:MAG TPA: hypothetical protein VNM69_06465 [Bacillus sp. (in: firmicutes)]|nr:hypothetical protein [Bacillus sp. (in: firmicutes)]
MKIAQLEYNHCSQCQKEFQHFDKVSITSEGQFCQPCSSIIVTDKKQVTLYLGMKEEEIRRQTCEVVMAYEEIYGIMDDEELDDVSEI